MTNARRGQSLSPIPSREGSRSVAAVARENRLVGVDKFVVERVGGCVRLHARRRRTGTTRRSMEVSSIAAATGVDTIGAAGRPPAADGACWWDGGVGRAFDEGAVAPRVPIRASAL